MATRQKVMVADADKEYCNYLTSLLLKNEYEILQVTTGEEALSLITSHCPDIILMDLELPDMDGMKILASIRQWSVMPVIILSEEPKEDDVVAALDGGADDFIRKSCGSKELLARIRAAIRHTRTGSKDLELANEGKIVVGRLTIDYDKYRVYVEGEDANLTQNEFRLVALLGRYAGKVLTYERIMKELWGPNAGYDNQILRVNMANIRRKVEENPSEPKYLFTENGIGYRMVSKEEVEQWN